MAVNELQTILEKHKKWLEGNKGGERADLSNANLFSADLRSADLSGANLRGADLSNANLRSADLSNADLRGADLSNANLFSADLFGADLSGANLRGADLSNAFLDKKEQIRKGFIVQRKITGWKKCRHNVLVKLEIPKGAIVFAINGYKCRTNIAKVVKIVGGNGKVVASNYDNNFVYKLGKTVKVDDFNCQYNEECAEGIHFFRTQKEAKKH